MPRVRPHQDLLFFTFARPDEYMWCDLLLHHMLDFISLLNEPFKHIAYKAAQIW